MTSAKPLTRPSTLIELISSRLPSSSTLPQPLPPRGYKSPLRPFSPNHGELRDIFHRILTQPNDLLSILAHSHRILDSQQAVHFSSPNRIHARSRLYDRLIYAFSRAPLSPALPSINDLLNRQLKEGVPVLPRSLTTLFHLAGQAGEPILPLVQKTLHLLPSGLDVQLLVMICRTIVREARGTPEDIEKIIVACYSAENKTEGEWDWSMWDILVSAYTISGDLRGALGVLKRYRKVLKRHFIDWQVKEGMREEAARPYVRVLTLWTEKIRNSIKQQAGRGKKREETGKDIPSLLARDLEKLLGGEDYLPVVFLNAWLQAEAVGKNYIAVERVWALLSSPLPQSSSHFTTSPVIVSTSQNPSTYRPITDTFPSSSKRNTSGETPRSDVYSWTIYLAVLKHHPSPPLRSLLNQLLSQTPRIFLNAHLLDALLSTSLRHSDLPLAIIALRLARRYKIGWPRAIDLICRHLIVIHRRGLLRGLLGHPLRDVGDKVTREEWEVMGNVLNGILKRKSLRVGKQDLEEVHLPFSQPQGRMSKEKDDGLDTTVVMSDPERDWEEIFAGLEELLEMAVGEVNKLSSQDDVRDIVRRVEKEVYPYDHSKSLGGMVSTRR